MQRQTRAQSKKTIRAPDSFRWKCGVPNCRKRIDSKYHDLCTEHGKNLGKINDWKHLVTLDGFV